MQLKLLLPGHRSIQEWICMDWFSIERGEKGNQQRVWSAFTFIKCLYYCFLLQFTTDRAEEEKQEQRRAAICLRPRKLFHKSKFLVLYITLLVRHVIPTVLDTLNFHRNFKLIFGHFISIKVPQISNFGLTPELLEIFKFSPIVSETFISAPGFSVPTSLLEVYSFKTLTNEKVKIRKENDKSLSGLMVCLWNGIVIVQDH